MTFTNLHKSAINNAIEQGLNFALFRDKNSEELIFISDDNSSRKIRSNTQFFATNWLDKYSNRIIINDKLSLEEAAEYIGDKNYKLKQPYNIDTEKDEYIKDLTDVIYSLSQNGGKVVLSRTIAANLSNDIATIAANYFEANSNAYCCLLHTKDTGCWLIASPELLLSANLTTHELQSVALAGTRKADTFDPWDKKNIHEQRIVRDFIIEAFNEMQIKYKVGETSTLRTNNIEHLATFVSGKFENENDIETIIDKLNPTPALCGTPREIAIGTINHIEKHPRRLYGGYFGFANQHNFKAIVTLRCAQLSTSTACIYVGGGITDESIPSLEWDETSLKSQVISKIITNSKS